MVLIFFSMGTQPCFADQLVQLYGGCADTVPTQTINSTPATYRNDLDALVAGDRLLLAAGTYTEGLPIWNMNGTPGSCFIIEGPESGGARFTPRPCCNTVSLGDSSYVVIRNLEIDGQHMAGIDAVKAEGTATSTHHITLENLDIHDHGNGQQTVGISTKCPSWNWVVRRNRIREGATSSAGTGMYFGNSDGEEEFVHSLIEYNYVENTVGYNAQIKHQNGRNVGIGVPASGTTVIRHNVFVKASGASTGDDARPNLLVGFWPLSGNGSADEYHIFGNFFYQNQSGTEALFQGTGNVAFYGNLLYNSFGSAVAIQPHQGGSPREIRLFHNTVLATDGGLRISSPEGGYTQVVKANAVFASTPLSGGTQSDNITALFSAAGSFVTAPLGSLPGMDLFPLVGTLQGSPVSTSNIDAYTDWDRDFNGTPFDLAFRGAYSGEGTNPGWALDLERKPEVMTSLFADGFESGDTSAWSSVSP